MKRLCKKCIIGIFLLSMVLLIILSFDHKKGKILCKEVDDGYEIVLYDKKNDVIKIIYTSKKPGINNLKDDIWEISESIGSPAKYVFYYDLQSCKISNVFFNPILIENKYVSYFDNGKLIISDLFDEKVFYKSIARDFTKTANPGSAIISIALFDEENLMIEYYKGKEYEEVAEIISLYD